MKRTLKWVGLAFIGLLCVFAFNTIRYTAPELAVTEISVPDVDANVVAQKLSKAIQFKTIAHPFGSPDRQIPFQEFVDWLEVAFPNANKAMDRTIVGGFTPLYLWEGQDKSQRPILISGHYDVVPVVGEWSRDPWAGEISDGKVWGRGALDMKGSVVSFMQAIDQLAASGFRPQRSIYVAVTQDEEIGGAGGAASVVTYFEENAIDVAWSLDEGSFVLRDIITSIDKDIASINVAEKGYMTVKIIAKAEGGHSSLPQRDTAVSNLARAITQLQDEPIDGGLTDVSFNFFDSLGPHMGLAQRTLFANSWFFKPLLENVLSGKNTTDAMLRTTKAPTMLTGSRAENVLPQAASVLVNFRLHPRDNEQAILDHIDDQIDQDGIEVEVIRMRSPSPVAAHTNDAFKHLSSAVRQVFGDVIVVPGLTIAGTDSAIYSKVVENSYRFLPYVFTGDDIALLHGKDEHISIENLGRAAQYYMVLISGL
jgi:carboxypeptidase PM20D1